MDNDRSNAKKTHSNQQHSWLLWNGTGPGVHTHIYIQTPSIFQHILWARKNHKVHYPQIGMHFEFISNSLSLLKYKTIKEIFFKCFYVFKVPRLYLHIEILAQFKISLFYLNTFLKYHLFLQWQSWIVSIALDLLLLIIVNVENS